MEERKRAYQDQWPWLTFVLDARFISHETWLLLGRACALSEYLARSPLQPKLAEKLHTLYFAKGVQATTAIEGNSLSEEDARRSVLGELEVKPSLTYQKAEMDNVVAAANRLQALLAKGEFPEITRAEICTQHGIIMKGVPMEHGGAGVVRTFSVTVAQYRGAPASDCDYLLDRLAQWMGKFDFPESDLARGILKAILAHLYIAWIHPFGDGNGRTARMVEVSILAASGMPMPACFLLSNHYNTTRDEYYRQLAWSSTRERGNPAAFIHYALQGLVDGQEEQIGLVAMQTFGLAWESYAGEIIAKRTKAGEARERRKMLLARLGIGYEIVDIAKLVEKDAKLNVLYVNRTPRTLSRDVNALERMGLLRKHDEGMVQARIEHLLRFMPLTREPAPPAKPSKVQLELFADDE